MVLDGLIGERDGEPVLLGGACPRCGTHTFPRLDSCPRCGRVAPDETALPPKGTVWTWTVQRLAPKAPFRSPDPFEPFAIGYVDLGPVRVESRLTGRAVEDWSIGDPVRLAVELLPGEDPAEPAARRAFVFRPDTGASR